jgi:hypothetical protein
MNELLPYKLYKKGGKKEVTEKMKKKTDLVYG